VALRGLLLSVAFLDELASGVSPVAAPELEGLFGLSHLGAAGATLVALAALGFIEPVLLLLADRYPRRWFLCGGLFVLGLANVLAAVAPSYWMLLLALLLYGPASGCGVGLAQASLADASPNDRERAMARWALFGEAGDLATLVLMSLLALCGLGVRAAFAVCGVWAMLQAVALWRAHGRQPHAGDAGAQPDADADGGAGADADDDEDAHPETLRDTLRAARGALANRELLLWCGAVLLCSLLDEIVIAFGALHLAEHVGATVHERGLVLATLMVGGMVGLVVVERLLVRFDPLRVLVVASAAGALAYLGWLHAGSLLTSTLLAFVAGACCTVHYPIVVARAYASVPGRSAIVNAVHSMCVPFDLALPIALGFLADRVGLRAAMLALTVQPVGILAIALWALRQQRRARAR
jgi:MFS family permease